MAGRRGARRHRVRYVGEPPRQRADPWLGTAPAGALGRDAGLLNAAASETPRSRQAGRRGRTARRGRSRRAEGGSSHDGRHDAGRAVCVGAASSRCRSACSRPTSTSRRRPPASALTPGLLERRGDLAPRRASAAAALSMRSGRELRTADEVDDARRRAEARCRQARRCASRVSWTGISSSEVTTWTRVTADAAAHDRVACLRIGPTLAIPATSVLTLRKRPIRPVGGASRTTASYTSVWPALLGAPRRCLVDLAGQQHVADTGRDRGGEVDHAEAVERFAGPAEPVEHVEVLHQRGLGVDRQREDLAAVGADGDPALGVRQRCDVEQRRDPLAALDLAEQYLLAPGGQGERQRGGDGGLAGAALAGDDVQANCFALAGVGHHLSSLPSTPDGQPCPCSASPVVGRACRDPGSRQARSSEKLCRLVTYAVPSGHVCRSSGHVCRAEWSRMPGRVVTFAGSSGQVCRVEWSRVPLVETRDLDKLDHRKDFLM